MEKIYDFAGIGIGPFNLGLAALAAPVDALEAIFFDSKPCFSWHPGLLLDHATLQVTFYADLVTLADPTSRFSFLSYLKFKGRLIAFGILENNYITRKEYNDYCRWVVKQLDNLYFGHKVEAVYYDDLRECYKLHVQETMTGRQSFYYARRLVLGIGSVPFIPATARKFKGEYLFHSCDYLYHRDSLFQKESVTLIGSGQSAAEIMDDLLPHCREFTGGLHWFTRSARFYPMDYSRLTLEMSTPAYLDYFYSLPSSRKEAILQEQDPLYKGINYQLINKIYDQLYALTLEEQELPVGLHTGCELKEIERAGDCRFELTFYHHETDQYFVHETETVILATGYRYAVPTFIKPIRERIAWDRQHRYAINHNYSIDKSGDNIFVQNAELHTHGFNAPDLSLGPYRNAVILKELTGYDYGITSKKNVFQDFGVPKRKVAGNPCVPTH